MGSLLVDRPTADAVRAVSASWLAFVVALTLAVRQPPDPRLVALGALAGALMVALGFAAASRCRPLAASTAARRARLGAASTLAGAALGALLVAVLVAAARLEPALGARFAGRLAEPAWRPWALAFESSILEEVGFRLFGMGVAGWVAWRLVGGAGTAMAVALTTSALLFGLAHLPAWSAAGAGGPAVYASVLALNGLGGVLFGWVFWRWGLPYAIACHFAAAAVVQTLGPRLVG